MPNTPFRSHAVETPLYRAKLRRRDGKVHQMTISGTWRHDPDDLGDAGFHARLTEMVSAVCASNGTELLRLEIVQSVSLELGR